jgi:hypothetical protein
MNLKPPMPLVRGVLNPVERYSEILFGVLMALTITGALEIATASAEDSRTMFFSTLGCNVAWGLVDAVIYVLNSLFDRGRRTLITRAIRFGAQDAQALQPLLADVLPEGLAGELSAAEFSALRQRVAELPTLPERPRVHLDDVIGAAGVFLLVVASTFPVALPFVVVGDPALAMRISRAVSLALLFLCGYAVGRYSGLRASVVGLAMVGIGAVLVALLTALGG